MYEIKSIKPVSLGKAVALVGGSVFVAGFVVFVVFVMGIGEMDVEDLFEEEVFYVLIIGSVVSVVGAFVGGLVGAFVYNHVSERIGGVELDIEYHGVAQSVQNATQSADQNTNQDTNNQGPSQNSKNSQ